MALTYTLATAVPVRCLACAVHVRRDVLLVAQPARPAPTRPGRAGPSFYLCARCVLEAAGAVVAGLTFVADMRQTSEDA